ncbi:MAG: universal stress protein [Halobacteriaceae archaeon]
MAERILVPYDGSPLSDRALDRVLEYHPDADITVLYVLDPMQAMYEAEIEGLGAASSWADRMHEHGDRILEAAADRASAAGVEVVTATELGRPARTILDYVDAHEIDHGVMGSHGRSGVSRLVMGSVAERVLRQSPVPVTIVR